MSSEVPQIKSFSIFDYGFRPFFLAVGLYAILPLIPWGMYWAGDFNAKVPLQTWHSHEMLFGFAYAAIAGFLLTAIPNWTNGTRVFGTPLKIVFCLWLVARVLFWAALFIDLPVLRFALFFDLALPLALMVYAARSFIMAGSKRNLILVAVLLFFSFADTLVISNLLGLGFNFAENGVALTTNVFFVLLAVIGGRVTANFTGSYFRKQNVKGTVRSLRSLDGLAIGSLGLMAIVEFIWPGHIAVNIMAFIAATFQIVRFMGWRGLKTLKAPILWVLHLGYLWIIIALLLKGLAVFTTIPPNLYIHALTVGAMGTYILGVMSRVALGHTGRELKVKPVIAGAFILISMAAILRLMAPFVTMFSEMLLASITLWSIAFGLFLVVYTPILTSKRFDGKPG